MKDEDKSDSINDILKGSRDTFSCILERERDLIFDPPSGIELDAYNYFPKGTSKHHAKSEDDTKRALDDILKELLDFVIPATDEYFKALREQALPEKIKLTPSAPLTQIIVKLREIKKDGLEAKEISPDIMIRLNLAVQMTNYLFSLIETERNASRMFTLSMCKEDSAYHESMQFREDCLIIKTFLEGKNKEIPKQVKDSIKRIFLFPKEIFTHLFSQVLVNFFSRVCEFAQCLELSRKVLTTLNTGTIERLENVINVIRAQGKEIIQEIQVARDKEKPKEEEKWVTAEELEKIIPLSARSIKMALYILGVESKTGGLYSKKEALAAWNNQPKTGNIRKEYEKKKKEAKRAAKVKPTAAITKKKRGPARK